MKCEYCNNEVQPGAANCPACGAPVPAVNVTPAAAPAPRQAPVHAASVQPQYQQQYSTPPKRRLVYILLAVFIGEFGVHNFYAGYTKRGLLQLLIGLLGLPFVIGPLITAVWAIIEAFTITQSADGREMLS